MPEKLSLDTAKAAVYGGLVFGAGGGGLERGLRTAEQVFDMGVPRLATLDELADDDQVVITTGVGAPGVTRRLIYPWHSRRSLDLLIAHWKAGGGGPVVGTMSAHPGAWIAGGWLHAALDPDLLVIDCAANGRGHPTVKMGSMGLASRPDVSILQAAAGGVEEEDGYVEAIVRTSAIAGSDILHHISAQVGGSITACRGPFSVAFCRETGAVGAVTACIRLGEAMLGALGQGGDAMVEAIVSTLGGRVLGAGRITEHGTELRGAWDVGRVLVDTEAGSLEVSICNEYMSAELDGERVATYPDLIVILGAADGLPTAAAGMHPGEDVVVVAVDKARIPLGAGVWDPAVYPEVEAMVGKDLTSFALAGAPDERR